MLLCHALTDTKGALYIGIIDTRIYSIRNNYAIFKFHGLCLTLVTFFHVLLPFKWSPYNLFMLTLSRLESKYLLAHIIPLN